MTRLLLPWTILLVAAQGLAADLAVGPGRPFARIEDAIARAQPGDTILVRPREDNRAYEKTALYITRPRLTIKAAAGRYIPLSGVGFDYSGRGSIPRAIVQFNRGADGCTLEGFELHGAHNDTHNGAGVRINQANDTTIRRCLIRNNDMGIMSNGDGTDATAANQLIENCLIHFNGDHRQPGFNHNLYLGGTSVTLRGCEVHSSLTGNNIKSRAHRTIVLACYVHDSSNRELDLVDAKGDTTRPGSDAVVVGNIIVKDPKCRGNRAVIHFGQDGGQEHDGTLWLAHNTIVTPFITPVVTLSAGKSRAQIYNNIVWDGGNGLGQKLVDLRHPDLPRDAAGGIGNWLASGFAGPSLEALGLQRTFLARPGQSPPFVAPPQGDFRLQRREDAVTDAAAALPEPLRQLLGPRLVQFVAPASTQPRPEDGKQDLGAYEYVSP